MIKRYGKSASALGNAKRGYFKDNDMLVKRQDECAARYKLGPVRTECKMCRASLGRGVHYTSHGLEYAVCPECGHVCGMYEETAEYSRFVYSDSDYGTYTYSEDSKGRYDERTEKIYRPKAEFLKSVLEHLTDFHMVLDAVNRNRNIKYLYMMVPVFGLSNVLETLLPDVFNRHLGGPHTHVFSQRSIEYMCSRYNMEMIGKWQFGTDMMDLFRMCVVKNNEGLGTVIYDKFYRCLDRMQLVLDENDFCSEMHAVFRLHAR